MVSLQADHVSNKSQKAYFFLSFNEIGLPGRAYLDCFQGEYVASFKWMSPSLETSCLTCTDGLISSVRSIHKHTNRCTYALMDPFKDSPPASWEFHKQTLRKM